MARCNFNDLTEILRFLVTKITNRINDIFERISLYMNNSVGDIFCNSERAEHVLKTPERTELYYNRVRLIHIHIHPFPWQSHFSCVVQYLSIKQKKFKTGSPALLVECNT